MALASHALSLSGHSPGETLTISGVRLWRECVMLHDVVAAGLIVACRSVYTSRNLPGGDAGPVGVTSDSAWPRLTTYLNFVKVVWVMTCPLLYTGTRIIGRPERRKGWRHWRCWIISLSFCWMYKNETADRYKIFHIWIGYDLSSGHAAQTSKLLYSRRQPEVHGQTSRFKFQLNTFPFPNPPFEVFEIQP